MNKKQISMLGCGWLGSSLAEYLIAENYYIKASTTTEKKLSQLEKKGIQAFKIQLFENKIEGDIENFLNESSILIINIPPGLRSQPNLDYVAKMKNFIQAIKNSKIKKVIYVSSTSVFSDKKSIPTYTENYEFTHSEIQNSQLIQVEKAFQNQVNFQTSIVRFGGLVGKDRHPVKYLAGRKNVKNPLAPVNLIHKKNCIKLLNAILKQQAFGTVFHGVENIPVNKSTFYSSAAKKYNLEEPQFDTTTTKSVGKVINAKQTQTKLKIEFEQLVQNI
ncbi:NAD(P)H-binding protein [Psychroflexus aestuariivivens]|uniref:NAD(P)H-binding protein n=1 Tax=Psychroflexus aestuariivivens TaxID=1795040 RepID=UPI000FD99B24|nr:NAD(P)H-binding protein [Psychroflexus aestuariivivens]